MTVKAIKSDADYREALARIDALMDAEPGSPEADELDVLTQLAEAWQHARWPTELPDPVEAIRFRMEQAGLRQKDLVPYIGSRSKVSEVLSRKRPLSLTMIRRLHEGLGIPAEVLIQEPEEAGAPSS